MAILTDMSTSYNQGIQTYNQPDWHKRPPWKFPLVDKFTQLYGYYEVRSRHPVAETARHPAWWMLEAKEHGGEIDIHEDGSYGGPNFHVSTDDCNPCGKTGGAHDYYGVYGMVIYPGGIKFYRDNQLVHERAIDWAARGETPFGHILSMYSDKNATSRDVEHEFYVDYFRVYKRNETAAPEKARAIYPPDGMEGVGIKTHICREAGDRATRHRIRLGETQAPPVVAEQAGKFYYPSQLKPNTTYYWSVEEVNAAGSASGDLNSFATGAGHVLEARYFQFQDFAYAANLG